MEDSQELVSIFFDGQEMQIEDVHLEIVSEINNHVHAQVRGMVAADNYDNYVEMAQCVTQLTIKHEIGGSPTMKFEGIITEISARAEGAGKQNAVYFIDIKALSYTYLTDTKFKHKSFQDINMTYDELIDVVLEDYDGADKINNAAPGIPIGQFILQYHDTDYGFLRRLASYFEQGLFADASLAAPRIHFGTPQSKERGELKEYEYSVTKKLDVYSEHDKNTYRSGISEQDTTFYTILDRNAKSVFDLADSVTHMGHTLYVSAIKTEVKDHKLYNTYTLTSQQGLKQPCLANGEIQGLSIPGKVIDVEKNLLKLHLEIDEEQDVAKAYWFDYEAFYATWYCMPELNDIVNLHFPTMFETDAIGLNSMKQDPEGGYTRNNEVKTPDNGSASGNKGPIDFVKSATDPDVKLLTTKAGRMIELGPDRICILYNDGTYLNLYDDVNQEDGIQAYTDRDIAIYAKGEILVDAKERVHVQAENQISLQSKDSVIEIAPGKIEVKAKEKKIN